MQFPYTRKLPAKKAHATKVKTKQKRKIINYKFFKNLFRDSSHADPSSRSNQPVESQ